MTKKYAKSFAMRIVQQSTLSQANGIVHEMMKTSKMKQK